MTIKLMFGLANEKILVTIDDKQVKFANTQFGAQETTIDGLQLSYEGVVKQHPDLKDVSNWREVAVKRFKQKISKMKNEEEISKYLIKDLSKFGYVPEQKQKNGHRPIKL